jgi:hypothetical protein
MKLSKINKSAKIAGLTAAMAIATQPVARASVWCDIEGTAAGLACGILVGGLGALGTWGCAELIAIPSLATYCERMVLAGALAGEGLCYEYALWAVDACNGC